MSAKSTGKTIVSIVAKKNKITIEFDDKSKITVSENTFTDFHLYEGKLIEGKELSTLESFAGQDTVYSLALKLLSRDSYSCYELREKLIGKGASEEDAKAIVERLKKQKLLDDERYARVYASDVADLRLYGRNKVLHELKSKGIPFFMLDRLEFPEEVELEKAMRYATMMDYRLGKTPYENKKFKMIRSLIARGFDIRIAEMAASKAATRIDPEIEADIFDKQFELALAKYSRKYHGFELKRHMLAFLARRGFDYERIQAKLEEVEE